ncbi:MAG: ArsS family sensor histidine kinase [Sulfuricurvum sp.]|uniref:ArsS family sensor histidine kinase n=1 Tax=Sulfuricurvum sp. TaxID=2025608 RepID=UPI00261CB02E|nr:ArsS family sensor histidine kinase [Sulfuricurvum sp.]MDD2828498.1 ArsS family sensor histidine kinase [Sulfuricurvum sp.]MDD4948971.1 ArsS family sensor histidine kinase [Sulfuricurvum sp.]
MIFKRNAVLVTVLFALSVTVLSVSYTFYQLYETNRTKHIDNLFTKYSLISQIYNSFLLKQISLPMLEANLAVYDLYVINNTAEYDDITSQSTVLKEDGEKISPHIAYDAPYNEFIVSQIHARMLQNDGKIYFWIQSNHHSMLLEDRKVSGYSPSTLIYAYITILMMLLFSFALIIYRLNPLRRLRRQIARFGEGNMAVRFRTKGEDEIALIANEMETAQEKIRSLIESRTLFLRNIMHELKTPIAKGRIAATMLENEKQQSRFAGIFERLEGLIVEFALIEEITSGSQYIQKKEYRVLDLIDGAIDMAMVDYDAVDNAVVGSIKLNVDYRLFTTAIKNMIDNAIKYSSSGSMKIRLENENIVFMNEGRELLQPLTHYIQPFTKDSPTRDSFGLGLYIVDAILNEHDFDLLYERRGEMNCFIFAPKKSKRR